MPPPIGGKSCASKRLVTANAPTGGRPFEKHPPPRGPPPPRPPPPPAPPAAQRDTPRTRPAARARGRRSAGGALGADARVGVGRDPPSVRRGADARVAWRGDRLPAGARPGSVEDTRSRRPRGLSRAVRGRAVHHDHLARPRESANTLADLQRLVARGDDDRDRRASNHVAG